MPMLTLESLGHDEAQRAIDAGRAEAAQRGLAMSFAVADLAGALIACQRMDGAPARTLKHAIRKAFTAAEMGRDTSQFARDLAVRGGDLTQWGDPQLTTLAGGCVVRRDDRVVGAVACGGAPTDVDEAVARIMATAAIGD
jgi:glc operon protein GlcG